MKRPNTMYSPATPFMPWVELAVKTTEMMFASAQVIHHRTNRIAAAGATPGARDRKEFIRMGQEKIDAVGESAQSVAERMATMQMHFATLAFKQMLGSTSRIFSLASTPPISANMHSQLMHHACSNSAVLASQLSGSVARLMQHALKPIHSRATGNAKRLLKY